MVGVPDRGERHLGAAGAHGDAERGAGGVGGRVGVADHQALPLQDDRFRLVLRAGRSRREPHGAEQAHRQHTGAGATSPRRRVGSPWNQVRWTEQAPGFP